MMRLLRNAILAGLALAVVSATTAAAEMPTPIYLKASETVFSRPHDLVLTPDGKHLLVSDLGNDVVQVLDPMTLKVVSRIGAGELNSPHDVAFDHLGRLLVADSANDRIAVYDFRGVAGGKADARLVETWGEHMRLPEGVAPDGKGRVFVTNAAGDTVLALEKGRVIRKVGTDGTGPNQYVRPHDIHVDRQGRVLVIDAGNNRLQILDRDLNFLGQLAGPVYGLKEPKYMTVDEAGLVYISDQYNNRILVLDAAHKPVLAFGDKPDPAFGALNKPEGVEVRGRHMWISDTYNDRVLLLRRR